MLGGKEVWANKLHGDWSFCRTLLQCVEALDRLAGFLMTATRVGRYKEPILRMLGSIV